MKVREPSHFQLLTHIPQDHTDSPPTQTVEPVLGFTPAEICQTQAEPKLTVQQILEIKSCKDYVKTPLQTLDGIYVNQPKQFLALAKEAKKLAEEFRKEQVASQWAGIPHEKFLLESFVEQFNSLQRLINWHLFRQPRSICLKILSISWNSWVKQTTSPLTNFTI